MDVAILIGFIINLVTLILITWRLPTPSKEPPREVST